MTKETKEKLDHKGMLSKRKIHSKLIFVVLFHRPQGFKGDVGPIGITGIQGEKGDKVNSAMSFLIPHSICV